MVFLCELGWENSHDVKWDGLVDQEIQSGFTNFGEEFFLIPTLLMLSRQP